MSETGPQVLVDLAIVNYNKAGLIVDNVRELLASDGAGGLRVVIVDNSCSSAEHDILQPLSASPQVTLLLQDSNIGYCRGCNLAVSRGTADCIVIASPDIGFGTAEAVLALARHVRDDQGIGILGPRQINSEGSLERTVRSFPNLVAQLARRTALRRIQPFKSVVRHYEQPGLDYGRPMEGDWIQSSCYAMRRSVWDRLGGFSERLFLFMGDCDICWRAWEAGYRVVYDPGVEVRADGKRVSAGGLRAFFSSWIMRQHLKDALVYQGQRLFRRNPRTHGAAQRSQAAR